MSRVIVLGTSAMFPLPRTVNNKFSDYFDIVNYKNKFALHKDPLCVAARRGGRNNRTRSCLALVAGSETILFDAGPDIRWQLKKFKLRPTAVFISHAHADASYGKKYLNGAKIFSEGAGTARPNRPIVISKSVTVVPFRVTHTPETPCLGFLVKVKTSRGLKKFAYFTDCSKLVGLKKWLTQVDFMFIDGSAFKQPILGHMLLSRQLMCYKKWEVKKVFITHIGHSALPHQKLVSWAKAQYTQTAVAYDGQIIKL